MCKSYIVNTDISLLLTFTLINPGTRAHLTGRKLSSYLVLKPTIYCPSWMFLSLCLVVNGYPSPWLQML